jgi:hypothetical protein
MPREAPREVAAWRQWASDMSEEDLDAEYFRLLRRRRLRSLHTDTVPQSNPLTTPTEPASSPSQLQIRLHVELDRQLKSISQSLTDLSHLIADSIADIASSR